MAATAVLGTPLSHKYWEAIAEVFSENGIDLVKAINQANLETIDCASLTEESWRSLYVLFAKDFFLRGRGGQEIITSLKVNTDDGTYVWIKQFSVDAQKRVRYLATDDGRRFIAITIAITDRPLLNAAYIPRAKNKNYIESGPEWMALILPTLLSSDEDAWGSLINALSVAGYSSEEIEKLRSDTGVTLESQVDGEN